MPPNSPCSRSWPEAAPSSVSSAMTISRSTASVVLRWPISSASPPTSPIPGPSSWSRTTAPPNRSSRLPTPSSAETGGATPSTSGLSRRSGTSPPSTTSRMIGTRWSVSPRSCALTVDSTRAPSSTVPMPSPRPSRPASSGWEFPTRSSGPCSSSTVRRSRTGWPSSIC